MYHSYDKTPAGEVRRELFTRPRAVKRKLVVPVEEAISAAKRLKVPY